MSAEAASHAPLDVVVVLLTARRFMRLSDVQLRDLDSYLKSL
jgi:hypothetical protein